MSSARWSEEQYNDFNKGQITKRLSKPVVKTERAKRKHPEDDLQRACFKWFRSQYPRYSMLLFAIPNGANLAKKKNKKGEIYTEINKLKAQGLVPGVADSFLSVPKWMDEPDYVSHGYYFEFKAGDNNQTPQQILFMVEVNKQGYLYSIIRTPEEFIKVINDYLK